MGRELEGGVPKWALRLSKIENDFYCNYTVITRILLHENGDLHTY